jgi:F-type H+-transporting ATPase subunit delta
MSEQISLARPYAKAIFELARDAGEYSQWSDQLELLAMIAQDAAMIEVINNPEVSEQQLAELIIDVGGDQLSEQGRNLVKLLAHNDRLMVVADINQQFLVLRDNAEQVIEAQLITAAEVDDAQKQNIETALSNRLGKKIKLEASVDESLIGGAIVRAGDWVVDGSVKAQLQDLVSVIGS